jgi:hypothetical protein
MRRGALGTYGEYEACSNQCNQRDYKEALHGFSLRLILKVMLKIVVRCGGCCSVLLASQGSLEEQRLLD